MDKVALVTGASRNIGRAISLALAADGYDIACVGRDIGALEQTVAAVHELGAAARPYVVDVTDDEALADLPGQVADNMGGINAIVNNAGIMYEERAARLPVAQFRRVLDTNLTSYFVLAQAAYPRLRTPAVILNIGSIFGSIGVPKDVAYCASKAAIEGLTRALAAEWARDDIRVLCVAPGYVQSDISEDVLADESAAAKIASRIPLRRAARAAEIGDFAAFLVSAKASYATGSTFIVDGGQISSI